MDIKKRRAAVLLLVFCLLVKSPPARAGDKRQITPLEAVQLAFEHNMEHSLFLWEQELDAKRAALAKQPTVRMTATPAKLENGDWLSPHGSLNLSLPLSANAKLEGGLALQVKQGSLEVEPVGNLNLNYNFFAKPDSDGGELSRIEQRRRQENTLVLQTLQLLINLRQALDEEQLAAGEYELLQLSLQAAEQTPGYDQLPLKRRIREQYLTLAQLRAEIEQLQFQLASFLGAAAGIVYDPDVEFGNLNLSLAAEELKEEWFAASISWRRALAELAAAQADLEYEQKTKGWQMTAGGTVDHSLNWAVGLTASKTLYPRSIISEELELALARAEQAAAAEEHKVAVELRGVLGKIEAAQGDSDLRGEHLHGAEQEWELRRRELEAGLVTPLQLEEAKLALLKAENDYRHARFKLGLAILELWAGCGRELPALLGGLLN